MSDEQARLWTAMNDDGAAILDKETGLITTLNPTAAFIWAGLQRGDTTQTIIAALARDTGEDLGAIERGVAAFLEELKVHNLWSC